MRKTSITTLLALAILYGIHHFALAGQWYVRFNGLDILMHILGGVGLALSINLILLLFFPKYTSTFWSLIALTFIAGVAWELFEAVNGIAGAPVGTTAYYFDSAKDLVNDTLGAIIASYILRK